MKTVLDSVLYFFGLAENPLKVYFNSDSQSIKSDWENIGRDFQVAFSSKDFG